MTSNQATDEYVLEWLHDRLDEECEQLDRSNAALRQMLETGVTLMDVLHVLRNARAVSSHYDGDCFVVCGQDLDDRRLSVVVAPPSARNRVRIVKLWRGGN